MEFLHLSSDLQDCLPVLFKPGILLLQSESHVRVSPSLSFGQGHCKATTAGRSLCYTTEGQQQKQGTAMRTDIIISLMMNKIIIIRIITVNILISNKILLISYLTPGSLILCP